MSTVTPPSRHHQSTTPRAIWNMVKTPLTLLVLAGIVYGGMKWGINAFTEPIPTDPPPPCITRTAPQLTTADVTVSVWNGSTERGRATSVGNNLKSLGFQLDKVGNTEERITQTTIRGRAANDPVVTFVATFFVEPKIEADGRTDGTIDVLVGPRNEAQASDDWAGMNKEAAQAAPLPGGSACLPAPKPTPTPTATPS